jgi:Zn-finger nucleic acid-binding protein
MTTSTYAYESGIQIDQCSSHGIWLDAGELDRVEAWYEGNERLVAQEIGPWRDKLRQIERDQEEAFDAGESEVVGPISRVLGTVARIFRVAVPGM